MMNKKKFLIIVFALLPLFGIAQEPYANHFNETQKQLRTIGRGDVKVSNGVLTATTAYALFGEKNLTNYSFSFRARNPKEAEQVQIWAGFRHANRFDRYVVGVKGGLIDEVYLMRMGYMGTDEFLGERPLRFHPVPGEWYKLRVEVVGQRIRVFVGDEPLPYIDVTDKNGNATSHGEVTLGGGWITTEYDDLAITPMEATALQGVKDTEYALRATPQEKEQKRQQERAVWQPVTVERLNATRTDVSLDGNWLFMPQYQMDNKAEAVSPDTDDSQWHVMSVPNFWNPIRIWLHGETMGTPRGQEAKGVSDKYYQQETDRCENYTFDYRKTNGAWYRQWVELPNEVAGKTMTLTFDAVSKTADIYVNGQLACSHVGMFGEIYVDVTRYLHPGRNLIAVKVMRNKDNNAEADNDALDAFYARAQGNATRNSQTAEKENKPTDILKDMPHGFYGGDPAGIWQPVKLTITQAAKVEDVFIKPELDGANFDITLKNYQSKKGCYDVRTVITDKKTGEELYSGTSLQNIVLASGEQKILTFGINDRKPKLWMPAQPNLYNFQFTLVDAKKNAVDDKTITSGFRTFRVKDGLFEFNGVKYWLRGANHVPSAICPNDKELAHKFFRLMREGNVECTRTHTSPFNELWMTAADEEGVGVSFEGTWSWLMLEDRPIPNADLLQMYEEEWLGLLKKYRNHPSLLMWTVNNEMKFYDIDPDFNRAKKKMVIISDLVKDMRRVDPTRPMVYDSNYFAKGKEEKYGKAFMDSIDDGDVDDVHRYYNWYDYTLFRFFKGEFQQTFKMPDRPLISQEMSTGYPNNETGHPTRSYQLIHQNPLTLCGYNAYDFSNPDYFLNTLAFTTGELAECLRRTGDQSSGIMHFALLTWFQQCYDAKNIKPWPIYHSLKRALQPVLVSAEIWGRNLYAGERLTTRFYVVNDREDGTTIQPSVLEWKVVDGNDKVLANGHEQLPAIHNYQHYYMEPNVMLPSLPAGSKQQVRLVLTLKENGQQISANEYQLLLADKGLNTGKVACKRITLLDGDNTAATLDFLQAGYRKVASVKDLLKKSDLCIISGEQDITAEEAALLRKYQQKGGKLLLLNAKETAKRLFPEYINGWIIPTEGDITYMERDDDPVFDGIDVMGLRFFNDNRREIPRACNATLKTVRHENVEELAGQMKIHAYIDGGSPEDRIKRIDQMRGFTLLRIADGKGKALVSTMCTEKAVTDPTAGQLLVNLLNQ